MPPTQAASRLASLWQMVSAPLRHDRVDGRAHTRTQDAPIELHSPAPTYKLPIGIGGPAASIDRRRTDRSTHPVVLRHMDRPFLPNVRTSRQVVGPANRGHVKFKPCTTRPYCPSLMSCPNRLECRQPASPNAQRHLSLVRCWPLLFAQGAQKPHMPFLGYQV